MSESFVQLPPDSSGKRLRTNVRSVGGLDVHEQAFIFESRQLPTYAISVANQALGADKHHITLFNGSGSGKIVELLLARISLEATAALAGFPARFNLSRTSVDGTGGGALTAVKFDTQNSALPAQILGYSAPPGAPTVVGVLANAAVTAEDSGGPYSIDLWKDDPKGQPITLREGEGLTIQQYATANVGTATLLLVFRVRT